MSLYKLPIPKLNIYTHVRQNLYHYNPASLTAFYNTLFHIAHFSDMLESRRFNTMQQYIEQQSQDQHDQQEQAFAQQTPVAASRKLLMPAVVFHKTPNRQRTVLSNTSSSLLNSKCHTPIAAAKKLYTNCSPLRSNSPCPLRQSDAFERSSNLFNSRRAPFQENKENRDSINGSISNWGLALGRTCTNHPNKVGKFEARTQGDEQILYCQKCAILLASQGFTVTRVDKISTINPQEAERKRKLELDLLLKSLDEGEQVLQSKKSEIEDAVEEIDRRHDQEVENIENYFTGLHALVDEFRGKFISYVQEECRQAQSIATQLRDLLGDEASQLTKVRSDIQNNRKAINSLPDDKYTPIVEFYRLKLNNYKQGAKEWKVEDVLPALVRYPDAQDIEKILADSLGTEPKQNLAGSMAGQVSTNKKLKNKRTSIYFSFDAQESANNQDDVIPEENTLQQSEEEEYPEGQN